MATIEERPNKKDGTISYRISVTLGRDDTGKRIRETTTFTPTSKAPTKARKEAEIYAAEFERQVLTGDVVSGDKVTFAQFVEIWKQNWLPAKTPTVQWRYDDVLRLRVLPIIGNLKITSIRATHIDKILKAEQEAGKAPATVRMTFTVINSVMRYALKKQYIRENPCTRCDDLPPVSMKTGNDLCFFTLDQAKTFLRDALTREYTFEFKGHTRTLKKTGASYEVPAYTERHTIPLQWRVYFNIAVMGGLRRGEMCALTWKDVDFDKETVSITKAVAVTKDAPVIKGPKTDAGIRDIVLPAECFALLKEWKTEQHLLCLKMGTAWKGHRDTIHGGKLIDSFDDNALFIQLDNGLPVHVTTPGHKFAEIIDLYNGTVEHEENKLPKIRLHDLRHTSATLLLSKNTDIETVARRLGHSKASVTLDIYGHALPENDRQASDILGSMLG
ncbi:MAG: site-specific integrase [Clostridia bacterium]|nr:site-specific integrase [Clostridia bacterium]